MPQPGLGRGLPIRFHHRWAPFKIVSIIDEHTRECIGDKVERSGDDLIDELDRIATRRGNTRACCDATTDPS